MTARIPALLIALPALFMLNPAHAGVVPPQWTFLGEYSNIQESQESGDCDGYALRLWRIADRRVQDRIVGTLVHADGPCDKSATPLYDVSYDARNQRLTFAAPDAAERIQQTYSFAGVLSAAEVTGTVKLINASGESAGSETLTLKKH